MNAEAVLLAHLVVTAFLGGVIWIVQVVHYPLFDRVDRARFAAFEAAHQRRISWVVGPAMVLELATAVLWGALVWSAGEPVAWAVANLGLVGVTWASTALLSVPAHRALSAGFDVAAHRRLVRTNWIRTIVWTLRTAGLAGIVLRGSIGAEA